MRCYNEHSNRMHFPVVLESADSQFWSHELYLRMDVDFNQYPAVDLMTPSHAQMMSWVAGNTNHTDFLACTRYAYFAQSVYEKMKLIKYPPPSHPDPCKPGTPPET